MTTRKRLVLADALPAEGIEFLEGTRELDVADLSGRSREELLAGLDGAAGLIVRSSTRVDEGLLRAAEGLEVIGRAGVGVDNIDVEAATRRGIAVLNAPGGNTRSTAELAFALLLAAVRRVPEADRSLREGRWDRAGLRGTQLHGKTLGVVGAGRIGSEVIRRARAFGMTTLVHDPYLADDRAEELGAERVELEALLPRADIVTLHAPLTEASRGMIGREELARMGKGAFLINAARGGLVDEEALAEALSEGRLAGAALDVYRQEPLPGESPLRAAPNLVMTPHLGAATTEAKREVALEITAAVRDALLTGDLRAALNAPRVHPDRRREVEPILDLGGRLGRFLFVLTGGRCQRLQIRYGGEHTEVLRPLASAVAVGYLEPSTDRPINVVNSLLMAAERGIEVERVRIRGVGGFPNYVEVVASSDRGAPDSGASRAGGREATGKEEAGSEERLVAGALLGGGRHPRLVRIDDFRVDIRPGGILLLVRNRDVPGVIGQVGTRLGEAGVNIAQWHQARREPGGEAMGVIRVDGPVPEAVMDSLRRLPAVQGVRQVVFDV